MKRATIVAIFVFVFVFRPPWILQINHIERGVIANAYTCGETAGMNYALVKLSSIPPKAIAGSPCAKIRELAIDDGYVP